MGKGNRMKNMHGGDIYRNQVEIDFSININPLGMPGAVEKTLHNAVAECCQYPDIKAERLRETLGYMLGIPGEWILPGNGASELFMAIMHGVRPKKTVIPIPSFYGYEYAAKAVESEIIYYQTEAENGFTYGEDFFGVLTEEVELLILANPNNPTGNLLKKEYLQRLLQHCKEKEILVVLDECFLEFCENDWSIMGEQAELDHVLIVRAFTKIFAIPGVRLGYLVCRNREFLEKIEHQLPEWNVSCLAQAAGCACALQGEYVKKTKFYIKKERVRLERGLTELGIRVFPGTANFILLYSSQPLYEKLLKKGILIRDCENFRGLSKGFYRIGVKTENENQVLLEAIRELMGE